MNVEFRKLTETEAEFVLSDVNPAFANALRRTLVAEVPRLAIDEVTIYDNTSALFDEMLSHRLSMLPVPTDPEAFNFRAECTCEGEGCPSCTVLFTLSKEGPGTVYSGDLTPADPRFAVPDPKIPIVKLLEGQRVMLEAAAVLGRTSDHAKWQTVVAAGYIEQPTIEVGNEPLLPATAEALARVAPPGVVAVEDGKLRILDAEKAVAWVRGAKEVHDLDHVKVSFDPRRFVFRLETDGSMSAKTAVQTACRILMQKLRDVEQKAPELATPA